MEEQSKNICEIKLHGDDELLWEKLRQKLISVINTFLDNTIDFDKGTSVRDEVKKLASLTLNFAEEKLKKPGIENQKLLAEVDEIYSKIEKNKAEANKINVEAKKTTC
ncbi:MAG: hypothetical protein IPI23_19305 [Bacteroidetes bacterium]|nr:hypothetical protein [Bacteroidota bacterium]